MQNYGYYRAKFAAYPQQHTTEIGNVEGTMFQIYAEIRALCDRKLTASEGCAVPHTKPGLP